MKIKHHFLSEEELTKIREYLIPLFRNPDIMFDNPIRGDGPLFDDDLMGIIASLYNMLHYEVTGVDYDYWFHWANKCGSSVEDEYLYRECDFDYKEG